MPHQATRFVARRKNTTPVLGALVALMVIIGIYVVGHGHAANTTPFAQGTFLDEDESLMPGYESWIGHSMPLMEVFGARNGESTLTCPSYIMDPATAAGKTVIISWDFFDSDKTNNNGPAPGVTWEPNWAGAPYGDAGETWNSAAVGSNMTSDGVTWDTRYKAFGQCLMAHGQPNAIIRVDTEFNNQSNALTADQMVSTGNPTETAYFKQAFQTFVTDLRSIPGSNFTFDWNPSADPGNGGLDPSTAYPGDAYVDVIGVDMYEASCPWGHNYPGDAANWSCQYNGANGGWGLANYASFAESHNKPMSFPEWGVGWYYGNGGATQVPADSEGYYIQQMWNFMNNPANHVKYESFWEDSGAGLYHNPGASMPNTTATFKATFGSQPSAPWPLGSSATSAPTPTATPVPTPTPTPANISIPFYLNAGGPAYTGGGHTWQADGYYTAGSGGSNSTTTTITGTTDQPLYNTERWGMTSYDFPIANGTYKVTLDLAEINPGSGTRVFNVTAENQPWLTNFNIAVKVGNYAADSETKNVTVTDGTLDLGFTASQNAAKVSAISIEAIGASTPTPTPAPTATPTLTPTPTSTPTPTPVALLGDTNADSRVNSVDLSVLLGHWGANYAPADFDHNGVINSVDLSILLGHWTG